MNKQGLVDDVATRAGLAKKDATLAVDSVLEAISDALRAGEEVKLVGFGTFSVAERAAGTGRNPQTGETIEIAASRRARFKASKAFNESLS